MRPANEGRSHAGWTIGWAGGTLARLIMWKGSRRNKGGMADGIPALAHGESFALRQQRYAAWTRMMQAEYEQLRARVAAGGITFLRAYGATNPPEFFAVATESFLGIRRNCSGSIRRCTRI